jgi:hypothetical protein
VAAAWNQLANGSAGEMQRVYDQLAKEPDRDDGDRQHPLEGKAGRGTFEGVDHVRWQIDVTSGHPKTTERRPTGKRRPGRN